MPYPRYSYGPEGGDCECPVGCCGSCADLCAALEFERDPLDAVFNVQFSGFLGKMGVLNGLCNVLTYISGPLACFGNPLPAPAPLCAQTSRYSWRVLLTLPGIPGSPNCNIRLYYCQKNVTTACVPATPSESLIVEVSSAELGGTGQAIFPLSLTNCGPISNCRAGTTSPDAVMDCIQRNN